MMTAEAKPITGVTATTTDTTSSKLHHHFCCSIVSATRRRALLFLICLAFAVIMSAGAVMVGGTLQPGACSRSRTATTSPRILEDAGLLLRLREDPAKTAYGGMRCTLINDGTVSSKAQYPLKKNKLPERNHASLVHPPKRVVTALVDGAFWAHESPGSWPTTVETYSNVFSQSDFRFNKGKYDTHDSAGSTSMAPGAAEPWQP